MTRKTDHEHDTLAKITFVISLVDELLARPGVTDLLVNGSSGIWINDGAGLRHLPEYPVSEVQVRQAARFLIARGGRHLDDAHPCIDVRARDGVRIHAVLPPVSSSGTLISVRVSSARGYTLPELAQRGMVTDAQRDFLLACVASRQNVIVAGATGSGKTTLLAALLATVPAQERIITIEDTAELRIRHPHVVGLESRQPNIEGVGELSLDELVRQSLRMRPDRVVVGECRGAEFGTLLSAMNTGHGGGGTTVHAGSLESVPARLEALGLVSGLTPELCARLVVGAFRYVVFLEQVSGVRRVSSIGNLERNPQGSLSIRALAGNHLVAAGDPRAGNC